MNSIRVIVRLNARPGSEGVVRGVLAGLIEPVRAEPGCLSYTAYESVDTPGAFFEIADWVDQQAQDAHLDTPHVRRALEVTDGHLAGALEVDSLDPITAGTGSEAAAKL